MEMFAKTLFAITEQTNLSDAMFAVKVLDLIKDYEGDIETDEDEWQLGCVTEIVNSLRRGEFTRKLACQLIKDTCVIYDADLEPACGFDDILDEDEYYN